MYYAELYVHIHWLFLVAQFLIPDLGIQKELLHVPLHWSSDRSVPLGYSYFSISLNHHPDQYIQCILRQRIQEHLS